MDDVVTVDCPSCGEPTAVGVSLGEEAERASRRISIEADCDVCCRPLRVLVTIRRGSVVQAEVASGW
jgi:Cysteine-rich CPXCG